MGQGSVARDSGLIGCPSRTMWNSGAEVSRRSRGAVTKRGGMVWPMKTTEVTMGSDYCVRVQKGRPGQKTGMVKCSSGHLAREEKSKTVTFKSLKPERRVRLILRLQQAEEDRGVDIRRESSRLQARGPAGEPAVRTALRPAAGDGGGWGLPVPRTVLGEEGCGWGPCLGVDWWQGGADGGVVSGGPLNSR